MASSVCCVVYASHDKLRVQSSLASWMLRGPVAWRLRTVLVPASRSQDVDQVGGAAEGGDLCKDSVDGGLRSPAAAFWRARISVCRGGRPGEGLLGPRRIGGEGGGGRREEGGEGGEEGGGEEEEGGGGGRRRAEEGG